MVIKVGNSIPAGVLKELGPTGPVTVSTEEIFSGKRVVLFSCPGAFTPKSTDQQVPSYLEHADEFRDLGIDNIVCISVNDSFVMDAWAKACGVGDKIRMLADGQCEFHTSLGLEMDCTRFTLGYRNHRFSMLVEDGQVTQLNVEDPPGAYVASDAAVLLEQLQEQS